MKCKLLLTKWCLGMCDFISSMLMEVFWFGNGMPFPFSFFLSMSTPTWYLLLLFSLCYFPFLLSDLIFSLLYSPCLCLSISPTSDSPLALLQAGSRHTPLTFFPFCCNLKDSRYHTTFSVHHYSRERSIWIRVLASRLLVTNEVLLIASGYWMLIMDWKLFWVHYRYSHLILTAAC